MKAVFCLCLLVALALAEPQAKYSSRYDNIDLDEIMSNRRLLTAYVNCLLEKGRCTPEGKELKSHIKEALETHCARCTDAQKSGTQRMIGHLINNEPQFWDELKAKYDPDNKFSQEYERELRTVKG